MQNNTILITGASSGLGEEMAYQFAAKGYQLALCARRLERLQQVKANILKHSPQATVYIYLLDVDQHEQVFTVFHQAHQQLKSLDRIIINAGIGVGASIGTGYFQQNKKTATTNFISALAQCEAAMEIFREQNSGHLVAISSMSALRGFHRTLTTYAATKAALSTLLEGIRMDVMHKPITVSTIHPGFIASEMTAGLKKLPFLVDTTTGCREIVAAIEAKKEISYLPYWPWAWLRFYFYLAPLSWLRKMG